MLALRREKQLPWSWPLATIKIMLVIIFEKCEKTLVKRKCWKQFLFLFFIFIFKLGFSKLFMIFVMIYSLTKEIIPHEVSFLTYESSFLRTKLKLQREIDTLILINCFVKSNNTKNSKKAPKFSFSLFLIIFTETILNKCCSAKLKSHTTNTRDMRAIYSPLSKPKFSYP